MKGVRKLQSALILRLGSQDGKGGNVLFLSNPASWWPGNKHVECPAVGREIPWSRVHRGNQEDTEETKKATHFLVITLSLCKSIRGTERWKQLSILARENTTSNLTQSLCQGSWGVLSPAALIERNSVVPWHCASGFAFLPWFFGHKPPQAAPARVLSLISFPMPLEAISF